MGEKYMIRRPAEKREFIRIFFNAEAEVLLDGHSIRSDRGINVSMGGLHLTTAESAPAGASCRAVIRLHKESHPITIQIDGTIVRSAPGSLAVEFTRLDLESYHHLRRLIQLNTDDPEKAEEEFVAHWGIRRPAL